MDISSGLPWQDWKVLLAEGWNNEPTPQQRQAHAHAATQQADDIGRPAERRRQQAEAQQEPDDIFRSQVSMLPVVQMFVGITSCPLLGLLLTLPSQCAVPAAQHVSCLLAMSLQTGC